MLFELVELVVELFDTLNVVFVMLKVFVEISRGL